MLHVFSQGGFPLENSAKALGDVDSEGISVIISQPHDRLNVLPDL